MRRKISEKPSPVHGKIGENEGLSVLTSAQISELQKYLSRPLKTYDHHIWDGDLVQAWRDIYEGDSKVLSNLEASIADSACTKQFQDAEVTISQFNSYQEEEPVNGLHYASVRAACALVKEIFSVGSLVPLEVKSENDLMEMWNSPKASAGVINIGHSKEDSVGITLSAFSAIKAMIKRGEPYEKLLLPCLVFHRAQISGFIDSEGDYLPSGLKKKDRLIWGEDAASVSIEGQYAVPYIERLSSGCIQYAGGKDPETLRSTIRGWHERKSYWVSTDYSKFDQHVPSWLIYWCFDVIKSHYNKVYWPELDWIAYNFVNTKIAIPGVGVLQKHKGIPSGSNFTQVVGSMANAVMALSFIASLCASNQLQDKIRYVRKVLGYGRGTPLCMMVMGDDNLLFTSEKVDMNQYSEYVKTVFGEEVKAEKCTAGDRFIYPEFLKREWRRNGEYQDPSYLTINTSHNERERTYRDYSPWHIIYGLYLTYKEAFPNWISERYIVEKMQENGGIAALERIPKHAMPGVFRAYGDKALKYMRSRAEVLLRAA